MNDYKITKQLIKRFKQAAMFDCIGQVEVEINWEE